MPENHIKPIPAMTPDQIAKFWSLVDIQSANECWEWKGCRFRRGYGRFKIGRLDYKAHRIAFSLSRGINPNLLVLHACDNPPCSNPDHLFEGTAIDNRRDCVQKNRTYRGYGEANGQSKLKETDVINIRARYASGGTSMYILAAEFNTTAGHICNIVNRKKWRHI